MILMFCNKCADIVRLIPGRGLRRCACGAAHGEYKENHPVLEVNKNGILLEMNDDQLTHALIQYDEKHWQNSGMVTSYIITEFDNRVKIIP